MIVTALEKDYEEVRDAKNPTCDKILMMTVTMPWKTNDSLVMIIVVLRKILIFGLTPRSESTPSRQKKTLGRNIETLIERKTFRCNWLLKKTIAFNWNKLFAKWLWSCQYFPNIILRCIEGILQSNIEEHQRASIEYLWTSQSILRTSENFLRTSIAHLRRTSEHLRTSEIVS